MYEIPADERPKSGMTDICPHFQTEECGQVLTCTKGGDGCPLKSERYY